MPVDRRAEALGVGVALITARFHGVETDPAPLTEGVDLVEQLDAVCWLAAQLVRHGFDGNGPAVLEIVGAACQWVDSGGTDAGP